MNYIFNKIVLQFQVKSTHRLFQILRFLQAFYQFLLTYFTKEKLYIIYSLIILFKITFIHFMT